MHTLGMQIVAEYYECSADTLSDVSEIERILLGAAEEMQATVITSAFHHFSPMGVSGVVVIQESHIAIHTWPEYGYAAIDIFTCGTELRPIKGYEYLLKALGAAKGSMMELLRGHKALMPVNEYTHPYSDEVVTPTMYRNTWFTERNGNMAFSLRYKDNILYNGRSQFQKVQMYDTYEYGRMLVLDNKVMTTERDEFVYHEMMAHVPMLVHPDPKRVLIIGGGDGGTAREVLKHNAVEELVVVEIDGDVVEVSKQFLPGLADSFSDKKVDLRIDDGIAYINECPDARFDVIMIDSTDPEGPAAGLFGYDFYANVYRVLNEDGIMVVQGESPFFNQQTFCQVRWCHQDIFGKDNVHTYLVSIPTYPSGLWSFGFASKGLRPADIDKNRADAFCAEHALKYYNPDIHHSAFVLPNMVRALLDKPMKADLPENEFVSPLITGNK